MSAYLLTEAVVHDVEAYEKSNRRRSMWRATAGSTVVEVGKLRCSSVIGIQNGW